MIEYKLFIKKKVFGPLCAGLLYADLFGQARPGPARPGPARPGPASFVMDETGPARGLPGPCRRLISSLTNAMRSSVVSSIELRTDASKSKCLIVSTNNRRFLHTSTQMKAFYVGDMRRVR